MTAFITIRILDLLDILLVALLLYQLYRLVKGTIAFNIVIGLFSIYIFWVIIRFLKMELMESIMSQFIGVGFIALIIVFHPEIRRFLVYVGTHYNLNRVFALDKILGTNKKKTFSQEQIEILADACISMARSKTGALIVITLKTELNEQINTGEKLNARISSSLIRTIFFKNSPLHDGAVIIKGNRIAAAGCILPLTQREIDEEFGLRHRAAIGITEISDAICIIVSEQRGAVSLAKDGEIRKDISKEELVSLLTENIEIPE